MKCLSRNNMFSFCIIVLITFTVLSPASANGEPCQTPNQLSGKCIPLRSCQFFNDTLAQSSTVEFNRQLQKHHCGFEGVHPKVCCPPVESEVVESEDYPQTVPDVSNHKNLKLINNIICGLYSEDRIIGGYYSHEWMALISYRDNSGLSFRCSGTIINENYILTAAHCLTDLKKVTIAGVRVGEHDISTDPDCYDIGTNYEYCQPPVQDLAIAEVIFHPKYNKVKYSNDIGLIRLSRPIVFTMDSTKPICLPTKDKNENIEGNTAQVLGWGVTETGKSSDKILRVHLPVMSNNQCQIRYDEKQAKVKINPAQICAGGITGKDTCAGDGGGPLQSVNPEIGKYIQHGIVSFGSRFCGLENLPGVYTRVAYYMDWILDNMY